MNDLNDIDLDNLDELIEAQLRGEVVQGYANDDDCGYGSWVDVDYILDVEIKQLDEEPWAK